MRLQCIFGMADMLFEWLPGICSARRPMAVGVGLRILVFSNSRLGFHSFLSYIVT